MIILIGGLPGSGKTYLARKLSAETGYIYLGSDQLRKSMNAGGRYSANDKQRIYEELAKIASDYLDDQKDIIIDATFSRQDSRMLFLDLAKRKSAKIIFIYIHADEEVIRTRLKKPRTDSEAGLEVYQKIKAEYEDILLPHLSLRSADDNIDQMITRATAYIQTDHD